MDAEVVAHAVGALGLGCAQRLGVESEEEGDAHEERAQDVHLAALAVEVQGEAASVGKPQREGSAQRGVFAEALSEGVAEAVAAGHEGRKGRLLSSVPAREGRRILLRATSGGEGSRLRGGVCGQAGGLRSLVGGGGGGAAD